MSALVKSLKKASKRVSLQARYFVENESWQQFGNDEGKKNRVNRHGRSRQAKIARKGTEQEIVPMVEGKGRMPSSRSWVTRSGLTGY